VLDGTVLVVDLDGGHSGVEIAAHGLGGWNHGNSLIRELQACGWELRDQVNLVWGLELGFGLRVGAEGPGEPS
jgi:hypothetical protein